MPPDAFAQTVEDIPTFIEIDEPSMGATVTADFYRRIDRPVLSVWGTESFLAGDIAMVIGAIYPQAEQAPLDGLTHALLIEDPAAVATVTADFLARHPIQ